MATYAIYCKDCAAKGVENVIAVVEGATDVRAAISSVACTPCFQARCAKSVPTDAAEVALDEIAAAARGRLLAKLGPGGNAAIADAVLAALPPRVLVELAGHGPEDRASAIAREQAACTGAIEVTDAVPADIAALSHGHGARGPRLAEWARACCADKFQP